MDNSGHNVHGNGSWVLQVIRWIRKELRDQGDEGLVHIQREREIKYNF